MLITDIAYKTTVRKGRVVDILDTEDLVMESCKMEDVCELMQKGIRFANISKRSKFFLGFGQGNEDDTYLLEPVNEINIIIGCIQVIKVNRQLLYIFYDDNTYTELKIDGGYLKLNDREVNSVCEVIGLPYIKGDILYVSYYSPSLIRHSVATDKCQAQKNGIAKKRQVLLGLR